MVEYTLSDFIDTKAIIAGIVITLSLVGLTFIAVPVLLDEDNDFKITPGTWDISSPSKAATSLSANTEKLLYIKVEVFQVTETYPSWGGDLVGHFYSGISTIILFKEPQTVTEGEIISPENTAWDNAAWQLDLIRGSSEDQINNINGSLINQQLQIALSEDIENLDSLKNITDDYLGEVDKAELQNDILYWEIDQVYNDGTRFRVRLFGETIIIRQTTSLGLRSVMSSFNVVADPNNPNPPSYKGETGANSLSNYENAINDLLQNILANN